MQVDVGICNLALNHLLVTDLITNVDTEDSMAALACRTHWKPVLKEVLRAFPWRFALTRFNTGGPSESDKPAFGWEYAYKLPQDCVRVVKVFDSSEGLLNGPGTWAKEGGCILSNEEGPLNILYVRLEENADLFDASFGNALSYRLAAAIAPAVGEAKQRAACMDTYLGLIGVARSVDSTEASQPERQRSNWVSSYMR